MIVEKFEEGVTIYSVKIEEIVNDDLTIIYHTNTTENIEENVNLILDEVFDKVNKKFILEHDNISNKLVNLDKCYHDYKDLHIKYYGAISEEWISEEGLVDEVMRLHKVSEINVIKFGMITNESII